MDNIKKVEKHFDMLSSTYEKNYSGLRSGKTFDFQSRLEIVQKLVGHDAKMLLDCACGTGEITVKILEKNDFKTAIVCDISASMLQIAKRRISTLSDSNKVECRLIDIFKYSSDLKFDIILCLGLLAHTGALASLFSHLKSMLSPNGKIILQSSVATHWGIRLTRVLTSKWYRKKHGYDLSYYSIEDIKKYARLSGLNVELIKRYNFGLPFGDRLSQLGNYWLEVFMRPFSSKYGAEAIYVIMHDDIK